MKSRIASLVVVAAAAACAVPESDADDGASTGAEQELIHRECNALSEVPGMRTWRIDEGKAKLRVGVAAPSGTPRGDVLYLHGFADRFDNHLPLFEEWVAKGYRVIGFDFPSHGESCGHPLDGYCVDDLGNFARRVEEETREDAKRPLIVAGWSTGGLAAVRMFQTGVKLGRPVAGAVLFAPAVSPRTLVGDKGFVTEETLTRNPSPPHRGEITPKSPLLTPLFAPTLVVSAKLASHSGYPKALPTLVIVGGDKTDRYVDTPGVVAWTKDRKAEGAALYGRACDGAFHELDNEPGATGESVRGAAAAFVSWAAEGAQGAPPVTATDACKTF